MSTHAGPQQGLKRFYRPGIGGFPMKNHCRGRSGEDEYGFAFGFDGECFQILVLLVDGPGFCFVGAIAFGL